MVLTNLYPNRTMNKSLIYFVLLTLFACQTPHGNQLSTPPNIVFILVDDLGYKDVGFMGGDFFETPNIDRLASQGMIFTQAYAGAANCAPSRACLMSGQNTPRHEIYTVGNSDRGKSEDRKITPIENTIDLREDIFTLAELFKEAGYFTGTFGKWHLGEDPLTQGFDVNVAGNRRGNPGGNGYFSPYKVDNIEDGPEGEHLTDRLTTEAIQFIRAQKSFPFFLYLPYYSVHTPIIAKEELKKKYEQKDGNTKQVNTTYAAMVETLDQNVGRILTELEQLGLRENTLIVFTSDNGGIRSIATQDPLRAGKGSYYEGGIRVATTISWPGIIQAGTQNETPIVNLDYFPTFMDILGIEKPEKLLDGKSLLPLFKGEQFEERPLFWHFPIYLQAYNPQEDDGRDPLFRTRPGACIRYGDWKLHEYYEDGGIELYHLKEDIGERNNLLEAEPAKAAKLHKMLKDWQSEVSAPIPTELNPYFELEKPQRH